MTREELRKEVQAFDDLHQQLNDHFQRLARRFYRHLDAEAGGGKTDYQRLPAWITTGRRDDEDNGGD